MPRRRRRSSSCSSSYSDDPSRMPPTMHCRMGPIVPRRRSAFNRAAAEIGQSARGAARGRGRATRGRPAGRGVGRARPVADRDVIQLSDDELPRRSRGRGRPRSVQVVNPRGRGVARGTARGAARGAVRGAARGAARGRPRRAASSGARRPAVNGGYIHMLLHQLLDDRDEARDPDYESDGSNEIRIIDYGADLSDLSDEDDEVGIIELSDDENSDEMDDEDGPIHRDGNHINQPMFDEDEQMYQRELRLYHDDTEFQVPPAEVPTENGQPIAPDSTWGDCTMCSNPPVKPQGCNKCLQILGCAHCVKRWHQARSQSSEGPSCPLCRNPWNVRPKASAMKTIEAKRKKLEEQEAGPSTSSA